MFDFLVLIRDICLLRRGPQDVPYSIPLLVTVAAGSVLLEAAVAIARDVPVAGVVAEAIVWLVFAFGGLNLALALRGLRNRFVQAATALLGCALMFTLLILPIALFATEPPATAPQPLTPTQLLVGVVALPLAIWKVVVDAHVFRHSLDIPFLSGLMIALLWIIAAAALAAATGAPGV